MAEILLKIHPGAGYEAGDILCAFNRRRTRQSHAEMICHPWRNGVGKSGLRPSDGPAESMLVAISQYRFDRVSQTEVLRTDLATGEQELFSGTPNKQGESIDVEQWLRRRLSAKAPDGGPKAAIFGTIGKERWYGGRIDTEDAALDKVWQKIAEKTGRLESEAEFRLWPMGRLDIRHHLAVRTTDFSDEEAELLVQPLIELDGKGEPVLVDDQPKQLAKRRINCDWRIELLDDLKATEADVLDKDKPIGSDLVFPIQRLQHRSKEQPEQSGRNKLNDKLTGGKVQ